MDGIYWGVLVSTMLFGVTISQAWTYTNNNHDSWGLRSFVTILILMDFAITCLNWQVLRFYLMINFGNPSVFLTVTTQWAVWMLLVETSTALTEWFFASRIYLLNRNSLWAPILACLLVTGGFVCITLAIHNNFSDSRVSQFTTDNYKILLGIGLGFTLCTVVLITAVLVVRMSSVYTGIKKTHSTIQRLLLFFATRGLLVTLNKIVFLTVYESTAATSMLWVPFLLLDPKLHIITMMVILNSRQSSSTSQLHAGPVMSSNTLQIDTIKFGTATKTPGTSESDSHNTDVPSATQSSSSTDQQE